MHFIFISPERLQRRFAGGGCCNAAPDSRIKYATTPLTLLSASLILGAHFLELIKTHACSRITIGANSSSGHTYTSSCTSVT